MAALSPRTNYHIGKLKEKAEARKEKVETELIQLNIQLSMYEAVLNGGASLDPFLEPKITQNNR